MIDVISKDFISIVTFLFPGFLAAWIFYGLTSHPKPSHFERTVQALILTFIIQVTVPLLHWVLVMVGSFFPLRPWGHNAESLTSVFLALSLGLLLAYFTNNDGLHKNLRKFGFTSRTSHPSEWFYVLSEHVTFVILNLKDGRRIYGWPKEWPIEPDKGQFYLMLPSWILEDGQQLDLPQLDGILIKASDVQWVEFLKKE